MVSSRVQMSCITSTWGHILTDEIGFWEEDSAVFNFFDPEPNADSKIPSLVVRSTVDIYR